MYANRIMERFVIGIVAPTRFYMDGCWRKIGDGIEMYSTFGAFFRCKSDQDISLLSSSFVQIRVGIVVKVNGKLMVKLWLITSKTQVVAAVAVNKEFSRNDTLNQNTTLLLAMSAEDKPCINLHAFPKNKPAREYVIRFDDATKAFDIPDGLHTRASQSSSADAFGDDTAQPIQPQVENRLEIGAQSLQLLEYNADLRERVRNIEVGHQSSGADTSDQPAMDRCFDCHVLAQHPSDHAEMCFVKKWFISKAISKYVKIPIVRFVITFESPINIFLNERIQLAEPGTKLFSAMSDSYFNFETAKKLVVMTTAYTRIRIPIAIQTGAEYPIEKLVLMTSCDRALVCAKGSRRIIDNNFVGDYEHNTPLALIMRDGPFNMALTVHSAGGRVNEFEIPYDTDENKFAVPAELDVKSPQSPVMLFDATLPSKVKRK